MTTQIPDGTYYLHPEGSAWLAAIYRDGEHVTTIEESNHATHVAAKDQWSGVCPSETDVEVDREIGEAVIRDVMGDDIDPSMVVVSRPAPVWTLEMRGDGGAEETVEFDHDPSNREIKEACEEWVRSGEWGDDGASIEVGWSQSCDSEDKTYDGFVTVEIEPDHDALIRAAGGNTDCDHDWTAEGEGGLDENPGVWSTGGTSMTFSTHCRKCGLHRTEYHTGSQRNPGEHDTVSYEQPDSWCAECEAEECTCETDKKYEVVGTHSGYAVLRENHDIAEFENRKEADKACLALESGEDTEDEYEWQSGRVYA